jgi:hypothetical protein
MLVLQTDALPNDAISAWHGNGNAKTVLGKYALCGSIGKDVVVVRASLEAAHQYEQFLRVVVIRHPYPSAILPYV